MIAWIGDDYPAQLPIELPPIGHAFLSGDSHLSLLNDTEWGKLFPTDGFINIGPSDRVFQVSMIHQLHCLDVIRVGFVTNGTHAAEHIQHCLRYLTQLVLCNADTTLEQDEIASPHLHAASGVGMVHRCRDWRLLMRYVLDHPTKAYESRNEATDKRP
ncbi:hypothetical protein WOLCODRAFT_76501 [Wolfiporia cocos MD-104 SS10]|uniref:Uncharacterized protein n=1 Tax=Wolfiporia cocos (strain MD-104) TaxID=742152 RepID=A0A2H3JQW3_WOLCO|nr:hypothetical protein WOLCODRAFT_76501 [Wolfiporia cocos MD-104 SS10]